VVAVVEVELVNPTQDLEIQEDLAVVEPMLRLRELVADQVILEYKGLLNRVIQVLQVIMLVLVELEEAVVVLVGVEVVPEENLVVLVALDTYGHIQDSLMPVAELEHTPLRQGQFQLADQEGVVLLLHLEQMA
jgi:hypothetical protein